MTIPLVAVELLPDVGAWFTGRPGEDDTSPLVGVAGNLSHRRPHVPARLARDRASVCAHIGISVEDLHLMRQVHGAEVAVVDGTCPHAAELAGVDGLVTALRGRALAAQVADCVPLLLASTAGPVAAVHVGRRGLAAGVVGSALRALERLGAPSESLRAAIGPAIGGCCYEVPLEVRDELAARRPEAASTTTWGTPSLDLPAAVAAELEGAGAAVARLLECTRCDEGWFSHRADPEAGRQLGIIVRHEEAA